MEEPKSYYSKLIGHDAQIIYIHSPQQDNSTIIYSICRQGEVRGWNIRDKKLLFKIKLSKNRAKKDHNEKLQINDKIEGFDIVLNLEESNDRNNKKVINYTQLQKQSKGHSENDDLISAVINDKNIFGTYNCGLVCQWDLTTGELVQYFDQHSQVVNHILTYQQNYIVTGSEDFSVRFIDIQENQCDQAYKLSGEIQQMQIEGKLLYSVANLQDLYIINVQSNKLEHKIRMESIISSFIIYEDYLIVSQYLDNILNSQLAVFDLNNIPELQENDDEDHEQQKDKNSDQIQNYFQPIFQTQSTEIYSFQIYNNHIVAGTDDCNLKFWNMAKKFRYEGDLEIHTDSITQLQLGTNEIKTLLVSGSNDKSLILTDLDECLNQFRERRIMAVEHLWSAKYQAYYEILNKKKKGKGKGKGKGGKKGKK